MITGDCSHWTLAGYPLDEALRGVAKSGYDGLEICTRDAVNLRTPQMRRTFVGWAATLGLKFIRLNVAIPDYSFEALERGQDLAPIIDGFKRDIDLALSFGVNQLLTWDGRRPPGATPEDIHGWMFDSWLRVFSEAVDYAAERKVDVSVEVHPFSLGTDLDWLIRLCDSLDPEYFGVAYDCAHFAVAMPDAYIDAITTLGRRIKHMHFSDSDKVTSEVHFPAGHGCLDLDGIMQALSGIGFNGTWMVDTWMYPLQELAATSCVNYLKSAIPKFGMHE